MCLFWIFMQLEKWNKFFKIRFEFAQHFIIFVIKIALFWLNFELHITCLWIKMIDRYSYFTYYFHVLIIFCQIEIRRNRNLLSSHLKQTGKYSRYFSRINYCFTLNTYWNHFAFFCPDHKIIWGPGLKANPFKEKCLYRAWPLNITTIKSLIWENNHINIRK